VRARGKLSTTTLYGLTQQTNHAMGHGRKIQEPWKVDACVDAKTLWNSLISSVMFPDSFSFSWKNINVQF